jgi:nucleoside-diphosphate-sugar epimerase
MPKYLVTGCAGFIASRVAEMLLDEGAEVTGVDNLNDAYDVQLKRWRLERLKRRNGFRFYHADIACREAVEQVWRDTGAPDAVLNLAARAGVRQSVEMPEVYIDTNVTGTLNLLEMVRRGGTGKFLLASTSSLYGEHNEMPFRETADTSRPLSPYAASKKAAEALCHSYHHLFGFDTVVTRFFTVYGPAGRPDMSAFRFVQWIHEGRPVTVFGDGTQERDFTYVDDIARGVIAALGLTGFEIVNLGSDRPIALMDVIRIIERLAGKAARLEFRPAHRADVAATWANVDKARSLLGWQPRTCIEMGLGNLAAWYSDNREWASRISTD